VTRVAVVGAGRMGQVHLRLLRGLGVDIAAVVDPIAADATHADVDELLAGGRPDAAIVAAPSPLHLPIVRRLLAAGVPTLCEKPCGTTAAEAAEAVAVARDTGTPLQIGYWRRFVPELRALRERVAAREFGELQLVRSQQWDEQPPSPAFRATSGGILVDMGVHEFDQIRWLSGEELEVRAAVPGRFADGDADSVEVLLALSGGGVGVISLGRWFPPGDMCRVEIFGAGAVAESRFVEPPESQQAFDVGIAAQGRAFLELVRGGAQTGAGPEDAVAALALAEQAGAALAPAEAAA
jgi:myo-inositol 2-dehydrogenase/D-chiro-inositol 1-dehydrogenase